MKNSGRKQPVKDNDFLVNVARSIGSTLGAVAAKVSRSPRASHRRRVGRKFDRKQDSASQSSRHTSAGTLKRSSKVAGRKRMNRKKSSKCLIHIEGAYTCDTSYRSHFGPPKSMPRWLDPRSISARATFATRKKQARRGCVSK